MSRYDPLVYKALFEAAEDPMWVIVDNKFSFCNTAAAKYLGYTDETELEGVRPTQVSPELQPDGELSTVKAERYIEDTLSNGFHKFEWTLKRKDGSEISVEATLTKVKYHHLKFIFCIWRDISKRTQLITDLIEEKNKANKVIEAKNSFVSNMSRELRTPLNAIIGFSDLLLSGVAGEIASRKQEDYIKDIKSSGEHLASLVKEILDLSAMEKNTFELTEGEFDFDTCINDAILFVEEDANLKDIAIDYADGSPITFFGDQMAFKRAVVNLLTNAIKFTNTNGNIELKRTISNSGQLLFEIIDYGTGISAEALKRIFKPFEQGIGNHELQELGVGLGLTIVKSVIELHGGIIELNSVPNVETRALITMPANRISVTV